MKTHYVQLIALLLFVAACNTPHNNDNLSLETAVIADSLFTPTGDAKLDSMLKVAAVSPRDTNLATLYYYIAERYQNQDSEKGKEYFLKLQTLSEQLNWSPGRNQAISAFTHTYLREGLTDSAIVISKQAYELAKKENDEFWAGTFAYDLGSSYYFKQWYATALEYFFEAVSIFEKRSDINVVWIYHQLCQLYEEINEADKAIEYGEKAIALARQNPFPLSALGRAYTSAHQYEKGYAYLEEALNICKQRNNVYLSGIIYYHLGDNALWAYDLDKLEKYANEALKINKEIEDEEAYCGALILLSKLEATKSRFAKAETYIGEALQIAEHLDKLMMKKLCYIVLSELAVAQHKYRDHIRYRREWDLLEKEMAAETALRTGIEMETKYETEKKELEIERQQQVIARKDLQRNLFAAGVIISVVFLALLWYLLRLRIRRNNALTERNNALAEINTTKDKFFNIISHDLKNPAVAQRNALRLLVTHARSWDADRLADYHAELLKVAEEQAELIYNLLGWGQVQTGRITYSPIVFSISAHLRSDIGLLRDMANYKGVTFVAEMPDDAHVTGDANMLLSVVRNLLTNAIKFTAKGGTVTLNISPVSSISPVKYTVSVADTGTGMSEEQIRNLFRLDIQTSKRGTADEQGTGFGLIVCKEFLEKHGSILHVESVEGKGSRFWFEI